MEEIVFSKEELQQLFTEKKILDTDKGWYFNGKEIQIIAIHPIEKKYIQNMMSAAQYRIKFL